jgi:hypothetical protein
MAMFKAFKPSGMEKIARSMGYQGDMQGFQNFLATDPARQQQMDMYTNSARRMAQGGGIIQKFESGGPVEKPTSYLLYQGGDGGEYGRTVRIRVGSKEDTSEARIASRTNSPNPTDAAAAFAGTKPYDVRLAEYNAAQAARQAEIDAGNAAYQAQLEAARKQPPLQPIGNTYTPPQMSDFNPDKDALGGTMFIPQEDRQVVNPDSSNPELQNTLFMPTAQQQSPQIQNSTLQLAVGGAVTNPEQTQAATPTVTGAGDDPSITQYSVEQMYTPGVPMGGTTIAGGIQYDESQDVQADVGTVTGDRQAAVTDAETYTAPLIEETQANLMQSATAAPGVDAAMNATSAAQANPQDPRSQITAAQQTTSSVGNLQAAQGNAFLINNPVQRQLQNGELISGTGVDAAKAAALAAQTQAAAATANPSQQTMVANQLGSLMQDFDGANPPAWAAGAMRAATAAMAARGMGASSLAGQAIVQAAMESALPIAQADAQTIARFESQNLSNRQQSAMLAAEQRAKFMGQEFDQAFQTKVMNASKISDIANQNFTAEQQVQLENSRAVNTMNLANLSNKQALVMAEAAALAQLDTANLSNRQQAAVQNAQNFLQVDMANLSNRQQTELFKAQQRVQAMFTDQAAENAARQFNASSQNQVDQFFASLASTTAQFNATQQNAQSQFNAGQSNTIARFNEEIANQRDQFNATNQLVIAQANAQWRREIATADTAAVNRANELNAAAILDISKTAYDNLWQYYADSMEWAWESSDNELDRQVQLAVAKLNADSDANLANIKKDYEESKAVGGFVTDVLKLGTEFGWSNLLPF